MHVVVLSSSLLSGSDFGPEEFIVPTSSAAFQRLGEHPDLQDSDHARDDDLGTSSISPTQKEFFHETAFSLYTVRCALH